MDEFPKQGEKLRPIPAFVVADLPFPLAVCYRRLQREMDAGQPVAAVWQMKDSVEAGVKFAACLAAADLLHSRANEAAIQSLLRLLFKHGGLTVGNWCGILTDSLKSGTEVRLLPSLRSVFFKGRGGVTQLKARLCDGTNNFNKWRNQVFGHGVFQAEPKFYIDEVLVWLPVLHELYEALVRVLDGWDLLDTLETLWHGADEPPPWDNHAHKPGEISAGLSLIRRADKIRLPLGPLLSIQLCEICHFPHAFFFDRSIYSKERHRTHFLDYYRGHGNEQVDNPQIISLASRLPGNFSWERGSFDHGEVKRKDELIFHSFETEFRKPDYLYSFVEEIIDEGQLGYLQMIGPEGFGKTWLVRGLTEHLRGQGVKVLPYFIRAGERCDYRTFVSLLADEAKLSFDQRTQEMQTLVDSLDVLAEQFCEFLRELHSASGGASIIVILDGLDELPEPRQGDASIIDFFPVAGKLPPDCQVLLTRRDRVQPHVKAALKKLEEGGGFHTHLLQAEHADNLALVRAYITRTLTQAPVLAEPVLASSGGIFLYAFHLVRAISQGAFSEGDVLPEGSAFYPAYLAKIAERVGRELYEDIYLNSLLLLAAARQPVSLDQLVSWGLCEERLRYALLDLRDFLREYRQTAWLDSLNPDNQEYRYTIAHDSFIRYLQDDPELRTRLANCHRHIAEVIFMRCDGRWQELDMADDRELYALRHVLEHARLSDDEQIYQRFSENMSYASACVSACENKELFKRNRLVLELLAPPIEILSSALFAHNPEALILLATALMHRSYKAIHGRRELTLLDAQRADEVSQKARDLDPGREQEIKLLRGQILARKGHELRYIGRVIEAKAAFSASLTELDGLPMNSALCRYTAFTLNGQAIVAAWLDDRHGAIAFYDQAIAKHREGRAAGDEKADSRIATVLRNKAMTLRTLNRLDEAEETILEALEIGRTLTERDSTTAGLAPNLHSYGNLLRQRGRISAALDSFRHSASLRKMQIELGRVELPTEYFVNLSEQGECLRLMGRLEESELLLEEVLSWRRETHKNRKYIPNALSWALDSLAQTKLKQGRHAEALAHITEAEQLRRDLVDRGYEQREVDWAGTRARQAELLALTGDVTGAGGAVAEALVVQEKYYDKGRYSVAKDYGEALLLHSRLVADSQPEAALADLRRARAVLSERWRGGSFIICPQYLEVNRLYASMLMKCSQWQDAAGAVSDHFNCLDHIGANLPDDDPEPFTRCNAEAEVFLTDMAALSLASRAQILSALGPEAKGFQTKVGW